MPKLNVPQAKFLTLPHKYKAFVAGFGSGKTWVGCASQCSHFWEHPRINSGYFAPTYGQIRDIFYPTIEEVAFDWGLRTKIHESNKEVHIFSGPIYRGTILCRSMDKPQDIVGFKIGTALIDEMDILPKNKAEVAWRKIIARLRQKAEGLNNGVSVTTTPEGFKFTYQQFVKEVQEKKELRGMYGLVQASTYENEKNLPEDYIPSLRASYPPQLISAYLDGRFVNLTSGSVYPEFSRTLNHTSERIKKGEVLHIGMDFNVNNMTAIISVIRGDDEPFTLAEKTKIRDTPEMCAVLKRSFEGHEIIVYPDASGANTSSKNASESDLTILRDNGFTVRVNDSNPAVKDRVLSVNSMILNDYGVRRWKVNTDTCPKLVEALESQCYNDSGEPDKTAGFDHPPDALGYFINKRYPIVKRITRVTGLRA
jgi:hypothetical protein